MGSLCAIGLVWWDFWWSIRHVCLYIWTLEKLLRTDGTGNSKVLQEVLADLKMIYSSHCQNQGEEIYICFHLSKIQLLQENPTVRCSCYEFYFGKVIAFGKIQIGEICWKSPGQSSKKGFHRSLKTFVCSAVFPIIDTAPLFCFVEACVDATEHNQECQTYKLMIRHNLTIYALSGKLFRG